MKKAVFFTLSLTMFAFIVLSLSFIFAGNAATDDARFMELASINRIYDLDTSLQNSFSKIFSLDSEMTYTASTTEAIFQQKIPFNFTRLNNSFNNLRNFAIYNDKNVQVGLLPNNVSLRVSQAGIVNWQNISKNITEFMRTNSTPKSYSFIIDFFEINITSCSSSSASGNFSFSVAATGGNGTSCNQTLSINPLQDASVEISLGTKSLTVLFSNYSASVNARDNKVALTSRINYADTGVKPKIFLESKINITVPGLIAKKYGDLRIA